MCVVCHTSEGGECNAGGHAMEAPFGTIYTTKINPDLERGIGQWFFEEFERAMRDGVAQGRHGLYPAFPYTAFTHIVDADMEALNAYLYVAGDHFKAECQGKCGTRSFRNGRNANNNEAQNRPDRDLSTIGSLARVGSMTCKPRCRISPQHSHAFLSLSCAYRLKHIFRLLGGRA